MSLVDILSKASSPQIGELIDKSYREIVKHYVLKNWKTAGLDAGHFVEAARRLLEIQLFGKSTPVGKSLPRFDEAALKSYMDAKGDESYRILIPRLLWGLYALRNKRSIGHLGAIPASEIDAALLLNGSKWILSEIVRLSAEGSEAERQALVIRLIERQGIAVWRDGDIVRVLDPTVGAREQILILLALTGEKKEYHLRSCVKYKNPTNFRKILDRLDDSKLISYQRPQCRISPTGSIEAEKILEKKGLLGSVHGF